jgi:hypothetical protein
MMIFRFLAALTLFALMSGCGSSSTNRNPNPNPDNHVIAFETIACPAVSYHTAIEKQSFEVVNNAHQFVELYLATDLNSQDDEPTVDFDKKTVIALHLGLKPTPGYGVHVNEVQENDKNIMVNYEVRAPGAGCILNTVVTYPYCFITIDKTEKDVQFSGKEIVNDC